MLYIMMCSKKAQLYFRIRLVYYTYKLSFIQRIPFILMDSFIAWSYSRDVCFLLIQTKLFSFYIFVLIMGLCSVFNITLKFEFEPQTLILISFIIRETNNFSSELDLQNTSIHIAFQLWNFSLMLLCKAYLRQG